MKINEIHQKKCSKLKFILQAVEKIMFLTIINATN